MMAAAFSHTKMTCNMLVLFYIHKVKCLFARGRNSLTNTSLNVRNYNNYKLVPLHY